jgi:hypothetical protein
MLLGPIGGCIAGRLVNPADVICCVLEAIKESGTSRVIGGVISVGCLVCILWGLRGLITKYPKIPVGCLIGALFGGLTGAMSSGDCSSVGFVVQIGYESRSFPLASSFVQTPTPSPF